MGKNLCDRDITVVIAAKNEETTIAEVIRGAQQFAARVLVVDGHSADRTVEIARELGADVIFDHKQGKGEALRCATSAVATPITVFMDADGSHDPSDIPAIVEPIKAGKADHVTGSRLLGGSSELHGGFDECFRLMGSSFITACINWRFKVRLSDSQNGFRAIRTSILRELTLEENITTIEQEMIIKTLRAGYRIAEVPAHEYPRRGGVSKIDLRRVWLRYGWCLLKNLFAPVPSRAMETASSSEVSSWLPLQDRLTVETYDAEVFARRDNTMSTSSDSTAKAMQPPINRPL